MKLAVYSESSADEAAIRILVNGILGEPTEVVGLTNFETKRGFGSVLTNISAVLQELHYGFEADALAVILDSDRTPIHRKAHDEPGQADPKCRLCCLRETVKDIQNKLTPVPNRQPVKTAIGLAVPQIEAWLLCGKDRGVGEAGWLVGLKSKKPPYTSSSLKKAVYGKERYSLAEETRCMVAEAERLVAGFLLDLEQQWFPDGFGAFAQDIRRWKELPSA